LLQKPGKVLECSHATVILQFSGDFPQGVVESVRSGAGGTDALSENRQAGFPELVQKT